MPRRGGRGRGKMRARPPQVLRSSMQEHGGASASFESLAKAAAAKNVTASRSFYPPIDPTKENKPFVLSEREKTLIDMANHVRRAIHCSPAAIEYRPNRKVTPCESEILRLKHFYKTASADQDDNRSAADTIWDVDKSFLILDLIPTELIPDHIIRQHRPRKRARTDTENNDAENLQNLISLPTAEDAELPRDQIPEEEEEEDIENAAEQAAEQNNFEDDDVELNADYQTGAHFDDDEGYDEPDSGAEEATF